MLVRKEGHAAYKEATTELEQHERIMHIEWDKTFRNFRTFFEMIFVLIKNEFRSLHELNWIWFMFWRMIVYNKNGSISTYTAFFSCLHNVDEKEYEPRMRLTNEKSLYLVWLRAQHFWSFFLLRSYLVLQIGPLASSTYHNAYSLQKSYEGHPSEEAICSTLLSLVLSSGSNGTWDVSYTVTYRW